MKNAISISFSILVAVFSASMILNHPACNSIEGHGITKGIAVACAMQKVPGSCNRCHAEPGQINAKVQPDLASLEKYFPEKQSVIYNAMFRRVPE